MGEELNPLASDLFTSVFRSNDVDVILYYMTPS